MQKYAGNLDLDPIEIADGIFWLGYPDKNVGLHCNPYLIREGDQAVLIDGGNRDDFSSVMLKILRTGVEPSQICRLIYQHYDPDLCGNLPQMEELIGTKELRIISHMENNIFIRYYSAKTPKLDYRVLNNEFVFDSGRKLEFYGTPFCHSPGSFVTYDTATKTLFSSDIFGSYDSRWDLALALTDECGVCVAQKTCPHDGKRCPIYGIGQFHRRIMPSTLALKNALDVIESLDADRIAPQHGSILTNKKDIQLVLGYLRDLEHVGIDYLAVENQL